MKTSGRKVKRTTAQISMSWCEAVVAILGFAGKTVRSMPIKNTKEGVLYHLVFATKDPLGDKIWSSIAQTDARGQRSLF